MADGSWWSTARTAGFDGLAVAASVSCSATIADGGSCTGFGSAEEPAVPCFGSGGSISFEDTKKAPVSDSVVAGGSLLNSTLQMASFGLTSPTIDWGHTLLRSKGRAEASFHAMLQESNQGHEEDFQSNPFKDMDQGFIVDQNHLSSGSEIEPSFPLVPASYASPPPLLQGLLEPDNKPQQALYESQSVGYQSPAAAYRGTSSELSQPLWARFPHLLKGSPPKQPAANQLQFSNNTPFWNASAGAATEFRSNFFPLTLDQFGSQQFDGKPIRNKSNKDGVRDSSSGTKKGAGEPAFKKPRIETPSPLPTFKVRKEKLGDRITALQQLVSPFGKTDTASVLHEAIDYIKFLHEQVGVLSTPYLKNNGHPMQQHQQSSDKSKDGEGPKQDLRSRGLCLVPVASTFPVASETTADLWIPTFGGSYR